jgi:hypothetical protein
MKKSKKEPKEDKPKINEELDGLEFKINSLGEIQTNFEIDRINHFLDDHVEDKKLKNHKKKNKKQ